MKRMKSRIPVMTSSEWSKGPFGVGINRSYPGSCVITRDTFRNIDNPGPISLYGIEGLFSAAAIGRSAGVDVIGSSGAVSSPFYLGLLRLSGLKTRRN